MGGGHPGPDTNLDGTAKPSLDVTQRLGANLLGSATVNTDFAETEVDTRRTNFTRFPLFFPEKRTFFLEGKDIFEFGPNLGEDVIPFFSRRIGLLEETAVPLRAGGKVNGRAGQTNFGALVTRTGHVDSVAPAATLGAFRVRQNVLSEDSRRRMFLFIRRARRAVTRDEAAASVGISRKLAAFHLETRHLAERV